MKTTITSAIVCTLFSLNVAADDSWEFGLGLGVQSGKSLYKEIGTDTNVFPVIYAKKGNFQLVGNRAEYRFIDNGKFQLKALGHYRLEGFEADDSAFLNGMEERESALEFGIGASIQTSAGQFSSSLLSDVSGTHEGHELSLGWEKKFPLNQHWVIKPSAEINWRSEDLTNYYYGVHSSETSAGRNAYNADDGTSYNFSVDAFYHIDKQQALQIGVGVTGWSSDISDSPLVEHDSTTNIKAAYTFRF